MNEDAVKSPPRFRLFIGIEAPQDVKNHLEEAQRRLGAAVRPGSVRWVRPEQFHLTLRFLGNVTVERLEDLTLAFEQACSSFAALSLRAEGVGFFPRPRAPRVVWAGVQGDVAPLTTLQTALEAAVAPFSAEPAEDRFHAHLTLGRAKEISRQDADALFAKAHEMSKEVFGCWTAAEVQLIRSELSPKGARYTPVHKAALKHV